MPTLRSSGVCVGKQTGRETVDMAYSLVGAPQAGVRRVFSGSPIVKISLLLLVVLLVQVCQLTVSDASQCNLEPEVVRQRRLAAIKQQILLKLGMSEAPNTTLHPHEVSSDVMKHYHAMVARRKRRSLEQGDSISSDEYYHGKRSTLVPVSLQGKAGIMRVSYDCYDFRLRVVMVAKFFLPSRSIPHF